MCFFDCEQSGTTPQKMQFFGGQKWHSENAIFGYKKSNFLYLPKVLFCIVLAMQKMTNFVESKKRVFWTLRKLQFR